MTARAIKGALKAKGLTAEHVQWITGHSGGGWLIEFDEDSEQRLIDAGFDGEFDPDCLDAVAVMKWIESLPNCAAAMADKGE